MTRRLELATLRMMPASVRAYSPLVIGLVLVMLGPPSLVGFQDPVL